MYLVETMILKDGGRRQVEFSEERFTSRLNAYVFETFPELKIKEETFEFSINRTGLEKVVDKKLKITYNVD